MPPVKWYAILNYPNKMFGLKLGHYIFKIRIDKESCIKCGKCVENCNDKAIKNSVNGYPEVFDLRCEHCYRCIHHCPTKALSLQKKKKPLVTLNSSFFEKEIEHLNKVYLEENQ